VATSDSWNEAVRQAVEPALRVLFDRQPRYRYWTDPSGWRFCWTTERMGDGKFAAFIYKPVGPGSRSGKARTFKLAREVHLKTRRAAKQRAADWFNKRNPTKGV
jgi:hypothetical protein